MKEKKKSLFFRKRYKRKWKYVLLVLPSLFLYLLFAIYPNISIFPMSFYEWNPISNTKVFVGLHNYIMMFTINIEDTIEKAVNTLIYVGGLFVIQTIFSLILAVALQKIQKRILFFVHISFCQWFFRQP